MRVWSSSPATIGGVRMRARRRCMLSGWLVTYHESLVAGHEQAA
jgi:hypothetical protein